MVEALNCWYMDECRDRHAGVTRSFGSDGRSLTTDWLYETSIIDTDANWAVSVYKRRGSSFLHSLIGEALFISASRSEHIKKVAAHMKEEYEQPKPKPEATAESKHAALCWYTDEEPARVSSIGRFYSFTQCQDQAIIGCLSSYIARAVCHERNWDIEVWRTVAGKLASFVGDLAILSSTRGEHMAKLVARMEAIDNKPPQVETSAVEVESEKEPSLSKEPSTLQGHAHSVNSVSFSPDGKTLASGSFDNTVKLWDVVTGECLATFTGHTDWVRSVAWSPDGMSIASASDDHTVKIHDVSNILSPKQSNQEEPKKEAQIIDTSEEDFVLSPDGRLIAVANGGVIELYDAASNSLLMKFIGHSNIISRLVFSSDISMLSSCSLDRSIKLWDVASGTEICTIRGCAGAVYDIDLSPDDRYLAAGGSDEWIRIFELPSGVEVLKFRKHSQLPVNFLSWSLNGETILCRTADSRLFAVSGITDKLKEVAQKKSEDKPRQLVICHGDRYKKAYLTDHLSHDIFHFTDDDGNNFFMNAYDVYENMSDETLVDLNERMEEIEQLEAQIANITDVRGSISVDGLVDLLDS